MLINDNIVPQDKAIKFLGVYIHSHVVTGRSLLKSA